MIFDIYHQNPLPCTCAKTWNCALKMSVFIRIHCVSPRICRPLRKSLESQNLFFYFPWRFSLQSFPRPLKTWPSLRGRHCPRHMYFHQSISLIFPLEVVVHGEGILFFTWCHCLSNCCMPAVRARPLCRRMSNVASVCAASVHERSTA